MFFLTMNNIKYPIVLIRKAKSQKRENPRFALLIVSKSRNHPPPSPPHADLEGLGGEVNWLPLIYEGEPLVQN